MNVSEGLSSSREGCGWLTGRGKLTTEAADVQADRMQSCCKETWFLNPESYMASAGPPVDGRERGEPGQVTSTKCYGKSKPALLP